MTAEATCEMNGTKIWTATATISGTDYTDSYAEAIPATGHNPGEWIYDGGSHWRVCGYCGQILEQAAHLSASGATETEAEVCLVCGYVMTPALGHVHAWHLTYTPAKAATIVPMWRR